MENIAIIVPSLAPGGAERVASLLSRGLEQYYHVYIIVFDSSQIFYKYGGELISVELPPERGILGKFINILRRASVVRKIKKDNKIKATISILEGANIVNILSKYHDKTIVSVHSYKSNTQLSLYTRIDNFATKLLYNKADWVVGVSKKVTNDLVRNFGINPSKIRAIYNPICLEEIEELGKEEVEEDFSCSSHGPRYITVGRVCNPKGHWHLIRAFQKVKTIIPEATLTIVGGCKDDSLEEYLKKLVHETGMSECVLFLGAKKNPFKFIKKSDIYIQSSLIEGFGIVLCEALACGVPVISSDCFCGPREILAPETDADYQAQQVEINSYGVLTPVCDGIKYSADDPLTYEEECMAEAMIKVYDNKVLQEELIGKGIKRASQFDLSIICSSYRKLIEGEE